MDQISLLENDNHAVNVSLPIAIRQSAAIRAAYDNYVFDRLNRRRSLGERTP